MMNDSEAHKQAVVDLAQVLREQHGINVVIDRYVEHQNLRLTDHTGWSSRSNIAISSLLWSPRSTTSASRCSKRILESAVASRGRVPSQTARSIEVLAAVASLFELCSAPMIYSTYHFPLSETSFHVVLVFSLKTLRERGPGRREHQRSARRRAVCQPRRTDDWCVDLTAAKAAPAAHRSPQRARASYSYLIG
jgi:hypothetical protein